MLYETTESMKTFIIRCHTTVYMTTHNNVIFIFPILKISRFGSSLLYYAKYLKRKMLAFFL